MNMTIDLTLYEALTEAGVKPDAAHVSSGNLKPPFCAVKPLFGQKCTSS